MGQDQGPQASPQEAFLLTHKRYRTALIFPLRITELGCDCNLPCGEKVGFVSGRSRGVNEK
jgi:hypothetical protein